MGKKKLWCCHKIREYGYKIQFGAGACLDQNINFSVYDGALMQGKQKEWSWLSNKRYILTQILIKSKFL